MFYETRNESREYFKTLGLSYNPFKALVVPRPIGWISSVDAAGVTNLAPFSYFNAVSSDPPMVYFAANGTHQAEGGDKDTLRNVRETGEFVCNLATWALQKPMNDSSTPAPRAVDEFEACGVTKLPSRLVRPPRVAESPVHFECKLLQLVELPADPKNGTRNTMAIGHVLGVHIDDALVVDGRVDILRAKPVARLGYLDFAVIERSFAMKRPTWPLQEQAIEV